MVAGALCAGHRRDRPDCHRGAMAQLTPAPPLWLLDNECYTNYFLVMIRNVYSGEVLVLYERFNDVVTESREGPAGTYITFNGNNYDMPMLSLAGTGASNATLKEASDAIITKGRKRFH